MNLVAFGDSSLVLMWLYHDRYVRIGAVQSGYQEALECEEKAAIYVRQKVQSVASRAMGRSVGFLCRVSTKCMLNLDWLGCNGPRYTDGSGHLPATVRKQSK